MGIFTNLIVVRTKGSARSSYEDREQQLAVLRMTGAVIMVTSSSDTHNHHSHATQQ